MCKAIKTRISLSFTGLILLLLGIQQPTAAEVVKELPKPACLTANGAVIKVNDEAFLRINYQSQLHGAWRDTGAGPDGTDPTTDFYFRRNRLTFSGQASEDVSFAVKLEQMGPQRIGAVDIADEPVSDFEVLEAYMDAELAGSFHVMAGRTKIPFTREVLEGCFTPLSIDRSLFIATPMQRTRDTGVIFWGNIIKSKVQYIAAVQEGQESATAPESSPRYTGRVHLALLDPEDAYGYQGTYLGNKMVFTIGAAGQYESGAVFDDIVSMTGDRNYTAWTADIFLEFPVGMSGFATLSGAYVETDFDNAYQGGINADPGSIGIDGQKKGWYAKAGYLFIDKIGAGQVQPFGRYEQWDFATLDGVIGQQVTWIGGGLNYLVKGQNLRLTLEYAKTDFKDEDGPGSRDFTSVTSMLQFGF